MKLEKILSINEATFTKGYNDPEREYDNGEYSLTDDGKLGKQAGLNYEADPNAINKFMVSFVHPNRNDEGIYTPFPAKEINSKYSKEFATKRQAEKYLNSPYIVNMMKQYRKVNKSDNSYENDITSVFYDPYTNIDGVISQINLTDKGRMDRAEDDAMAWF